MEQKQIERILSILTEDARTAPEEIAAMIGASAEETAACIEELQKQGVIVQYVAVLNEEKIHAGYVQALIEVKVSPQRNEGFDVIAERLMTFDEVKSVYLMSGAYDLMLIIEGKTLKDVAMFVSERLSPSENVLSTATHFILKKYKSNGVIMEKDGAEHRLVVTP